MRPRDRILVSAFLVSALLHAGALSAASKWGECLCHFGQVVCPKLCDSQKLDIELPPPPTRPKPTPKPAAVQVAKLSEPAAAPKRGRIVLPDEAFQKPDKPRAETTARLPAIPRNVAVKASEVDAPVAVTPTVFDRTSGLQPGAPGEIGLGGTGRSMDPEASGHSPTSTSVRGSEAPRPSAPMVKAQASPPPPPAAASKPKGPSSPPKVLDWTDPPYPDQARRQGVEGTVVLRVVVEASGSPSQVTAVRTSGRPDLDEAAVAHVRRARFSPALRDGEPVRATVSFRVRFRLVMG
jgi:TonB family protein